MPWYSIPRHPRSDFAGAAQRQKQHPFLALKNGQLSCIISEKSICSDAIQPQSKLSAGIPARIPADSFLICMTD